jgi:hypothetical protein
MIIVASLVVLSPTVHIALSTCNKVTLVAVIIKVTSHSACWGWLVVVACLVAKGSVIKITLAAFNESTLKTITVIVTACTASIGGCRGKERCRGDDDKGGDFV